MKNVGIICLLLLVLSVSLKDVLTYVQFQVNQDYFEQTYCINRDVVELNCHASCYLEKELSKNHDDESFVVPQLNDLSSIVFLCDQNSQTQSNTHKPFKESIYYNRKFYKSSFLDNIFRPPWS